MSKYRPGTLEYIRWECNWMVEHLTYTDIKFVKELFDYHGYENPFRAIED